MTATSTTSEVINRFGVAKGDIFYCSWGYDQTNVNFYLVTRVTAAKAEVVPIGAKCVEANGPGGNKVVAYPDHIREWDVLLGIDREDERRSKLCTVTAGYQGEPSIVLCSRGGRYWARRWEGRPTYVTDIMFGH